MIRLRDKDIKRLARILDVSEDTITKMAAMELIDYNRAVDLLIKYSWRQLYRKDWLKRGEKYQAIALEYNCSTTKVANAVKNKRRAEYYCVECSKKITKKQYQDHDGLCSDCVIKHTQIELSTS